MEGRIVLSATGFAGNECPPEFDNAQMNARVPDGPFSPSSPISFSFNAADVVSDAGVGATPTDDIRFILDPDIDANFRDNGSTPIGATLVANDPGNNDQWDFSWTPTDMQIGTYRLFIIATDDGGEGGANPVVPLSDVFIFTLEVNNNAVVDLNGDGDGENAGIDFGPVTFTEGDPAVNIVDTDATIPFVANNMVASATIELTNPQTGDQLGVVLPAGSPLRIDPSSTTDRLVINVDDAGTLADKAAFEEALRVLTFENTSDEPGNTRRNISVVINDGTTSSAPAMTSVDTVGTNDRPVLTPDDGNLPAATVGVPYSFEVTAVDPDEGDLLVFQIADDPSSPPQAEITENAGQGSSRTTIRLSRDPADGLYRATINWTPTQADLDAGTVDFGVLVNDAAGIIPDFEIYSIDVVNQLPTTVADPENAPTTSSDDFAVDENNADDIGNILANDDDADGDAVAIEAVMTTDGGAAVADPTNFTTAKGAIVTIDAAGNVNYDPNGMFEALGAADTDIDEFWYTVNDGRGGISTPAAKVTVTVFGRNDAPRAITTDDDPNFTTPTFQVNEDDGPVSLDVAQILAAAFDADQGDVVSIVGAPANNADGDFAFTAPTNGPTSAVLTFDPAVDAALLGGTTKDVDVMVEVEDAAGEMAMIPIRIVVTGVTIGPEANNDSATTQLDTSTSFNVVANDNPGDAAVDPTTVDLDPNTAGLQSTLTIAGEGTFSDDGAGNVNYTPATGFIGTSTIQYTVNDDDGEVSNEADISVRVNAAPVAVDDSESTTQETEVMFNITDNDTDSDGTVEVGTVDLDPSTAERVTTVPVAGEGTFTVDDQGVVTFTPESGFSGISTTTYTVEDNDGGVSDEGTIGVLVNDPPVAVDDVAFSSAFVIAENETLDIPTRELGVLNNDTDDGPPENLFVATVNGSPRASGDITIGEELGQSRGQLMMNENGSFMFTSSSDFDDLPQEVTREVQFTYTVSDGNSESNAATVTIAVTGVNDEPVAVDDSGEMFTTDEDTTLMDANVLENDTDPDDVELFVVSVNGVVDDVDNGRTVTSDAGHDGELTVETNGDVTFNPGSEFDALAQDAIDTVMFNYEITDGQPGTAPQEATATITVTGVNDAPAFNRIALATELSGLNDGNNVRVGLAPGSTLSVDLMMFAFDIDGDDSAISLNRVTDDDQQQFGSSTRPTLSTTGQLDWTPDANLPEGEYTITVTAADATMQSSLLNIIVTVAEPGPMVATITETLDVNAAMSVVAITFDKPVGATALDTNNYTLTFFDDSGSEIPLAADDFTVAANGSQAVNVEIVQADLATLFNAGFTRLNVKLSTNIEGNDNPLEGDLDHDIQLVDP